MEKSGKDLNEEYLLREAKSIFTSTVMKPVLNRVLSDTRVLGIDGKTYLDLSSQIGLTTTGLKNPMVRNAVEQAMNMIFTCLSADYPFSFNVSVFDPARFSIKAYEVSRAALAEKMVKITGNIMPFEKRVGFEVSGATAVNFAIMLCQIARLRKKGEWSTEKFKEMFWNQNIFTPQHHDPFRVSLVSFFRAFHGRHGYAKVLTNSKPVHTWGLTGSCAVGRIPFPIPGVDFKEIKKQAEDVLRYLRYHVYDDAPLAFIFEPVQGEGGVNFPEPEQL
jgi:4-aminobutyrate aminotransferase-like enzyme